MNRATPAGPPGALSGVKVLDFSHALAGPYCTMILADLGADVLKVEHPGGGDRTRRFTDGEEDFSAYFGSVNRGKKSIVIDLKNPAGQELAKRLATEADVLVHNLGPGVFERLGLDYETLSALNPRLIFACVTGFGADGPWAERTGVDPVIQALSGSMSVTGEPDGGPVRVGYSIVDLSGGVWLAMDVLAALNERHSSGKGQFLDVSLLEGMMTLMENAVVRYTYNGIIPERTGSSHPYTKLTGAYLTADGWMVISISARNWKKCCEVWGRDDWLNDPVLHEKPEDHVEVLRPEVERMIRAETRDYWQEHLGGAGVLCTPINTVAEAVKMPPLIERGYLTTTTDANGKELTVAGSPLRMSRTPGRVRAAAPVLGEHSRSSLESWLGMSDEEYERYEATGVFEQKPRETRGFW
jgi:CoA:oxalate CoA-transferase